METDLGLYEVEPNRNAEAYRNLQQVPIPGQIDKFLDFIEITEEGCMLLGCSNLTGRFWCGSLWYFVDTELAPNVEKCLAAIECETGVCDGKFLEDKRKIVVGEDSGVIQVLSLVEADDNQSFHFTCLGSACEHDDSVSSLSTFNDKKKIISGSFDCSVKIWDIEAVVPEHTYRPAHTHHVTSVASSPQDMCVLVSSSLDGTALLWDTRKPRPSSVLLRDVGFTSVDWQRQKPSVVAVGSTTGDIFTVDIRNLKEPLSTISKFKRPIHRLRFLHCQDLIAACAESTEVKIFDFSRSTAIEIYSDDRHSDFVRGITWHPLGRSLYTCGWDKKVLQHIPSRALMEMEVNGGEGDTILSQ